MLLQSEGEDAASCFISQTRMNLRLHTEDPSDKFVRIPGDLAYPGTDLEQLKHVLSK